MFHSRGFILWALLFTTCINLSCKGVSALNETEINARISLDCTDAGTEVTMDRDLVLDGVGPSESVILYIGDTHTCNFTANSSGDGLDTENIYRSPDGSQYIFSFRHPECLVNREYVADTLTYTGVVGRRSLFVEGESPPVTRIYNVDVNVECLYELKSNVSLAEGFVVQGLSEEIEEEGVLTLRMMLFRDRRFGSPFPTDNNTQMIVVNLGRMIYVEITEAHVNNDDYELMAENCSLSDIEDISNPSALVQPILKDFCPTDVDMYNHIDPPFKNVVRFSVPAVAFMENAASTFITCTVIVCEPDDANSKCAKIIQQSCGANGTTSRARRSSGEETREQTGDESRNTGNEFVSRERAQSGRIQVRHLSSEKSETTVLAPFGEDATAQVTTGASGGGLLGIMVLAMDYIRDRCQEGYNVAADV